MAKLDENEKVGLQRSKGLGENDAEMMWLTTMNPETRRLVKVTPEETERNFYLMLPALALFLVPLALRRKALPMLT